MDIDQRPGRFTAMELNNLDNSDIDILQYWTPERKALATPVAMEFDGDAAMTELPEALEPATDPVQADLGKMPFTAGGKLYYTLNGKNFVASGNIFMRRNMVLTAAHCVQDKKTGNLAENFLFAQCYSGEQASDNFTFRTVALKENWYLKKDVAFDYAIAIIDKNSQFGEPLRYTIDPDIEGRAVTSMGYPVEYYGGAQMMYTKGTLTARQNHWIMPGSKMGPGSSGGAWVLSDGVTAVGLNAYVVRSGSQIAYSGSPKFDIEFEKLYKYALTLI